MKNKEIKYHLMVIVGEELAYNDSYDTSADLQNALDEAEKAVEAVL